FGLDQFVDPLEMILGGFGPKQGEPCRGLRAAARLWHARTYISGEHTSEIYTTLFRSLWPRSVRGSARDDPRWIRTEARRALSRAESGCAFVACEDVYIGRAHVRNLHDALPISLASISSWIRSR